MKRTDRIILSALPVVALIAGFWFLLLSPKRDEASKLEKEVAALEDSVKRNEQAVVEAERAQERFPVLYRQVVRLGRATPSFSPDGDTARLLDQLSALSKRTGARLGAVKLAEGAGGGAAAAPAPAPAQEGDSDDKSSEEAVDPSNQSGQLGVASGAGGSVPGEASTVLTPLGATIGAAGFPVMPYSLEVSGSYFELSKFLRELARLVRADGDRVVARGRLFTIEGFELSGGEGSGLGGKFNVTTYLMNPAQGPTAGATPAGPAEGSAAPASAQAQAAGGKATG